MIRAEIIRELNAASERLFVLIAESLKHIRQNSGSVNLSFSWCGLCLYVLARKKRKVGAKLGDKPKET